MSARIGRTRWSRVPPPRPWWGWKDGGWACPAVLVAAVPVAVVLETAGAGTGGSGDGARGLVAAGVLACCCGCVVIGAGAFLAVGAGSGVAVAAATGATGATREGGGAADDTRLCGDSEWSPCGLGWLLEFASSVSGVSLSGAVPCSL